MLDIRDRITTLAETSPVRLGGEASWWLHRTSERQLLRYEVEMTKTIPAGLSVLCLYDVQRFGGDVVLDVLRTHPTSLVGDLPVKNPYYLPAHKILDEEF
jgi:hypothetical protein